MKRNDLKMGERGETLLAWARRWLAPEDVARVVEPAVADWRHEGHGRWAVLRTVLLLLVGERLRAARAAPWWLLAFPILCVALGTLALGGGAAAAQAVYVGFGALVFALVVTTPRRFLVGPQGGAEPLERWAWLAVVGLGVTLVVGQSDMGATRWLAVGPLKVQMTVLLLPLVAVGGRWPAMVASVLLAAAPDALASAALAVAVPHPATLVMALVGLLREPAMTIDAAMPLWAALSLLAVVAVSWRWRGLPEGRLLLALVVFGAVAHAVGHAPLPLVGYGGSAVVATCMAFALAVTRDRRWTERAAVG